ncbi:MAG: cell division protein FtsL [Bdellovibrionales bacterium]|nr:cell division protein FtsL [Bdellovibrionales bacterium]
MMAWLLAATVFCSLVYVRSRFFVVELSYEIAQKRRHKENVEKENRELSLELSILKSPSRIENIAKEKFSLSYKPQHFHHTIMMEN